MRIVRGPFRKTPAGGLIEILLTVAAAIAIALGVQALVVKPYRIPSRSMVPTLEVGQRVLVNRVGNSFGDPRRGDVLVFHPPVQAAAQICANPDQGQGTDEPCATPSAARDGQNFIKRVIGLPGDRIAIRKGLAIVNGRPLREPYARTCTVSNCDFPQAVVVPPKTYFMMGDNRGDSDDSRFWGPVPRSWIVGRAFATYWPVGRIGTL